MPLGQFALPGQATRERRYKATAITSRRLIVPMSGARLKAVLETFADNLQSIPITNSGDMVRSAVSYTIVSARVGRLSNLRRRAAVVRSIRPRISHRRLGRVTRTPKDRHLGRGDD